MQVYRKERKTCRIRFFRKFFLEEVIIITMHVQDNPSRIRFMRHRTRRTSIRIFNQRCMKILIIRFYVNRVNLIRFAKFRVHSLLRQSVINDRLQRCCRELLTVSFVLFLFLAGGKACICGSRKKQYGNNSNEKYFCSIHAHMIIKHLY